jgi:hypothetical protein
MVAVNRLTCCGGWPRQCARGEGAPCPTNRCVTLSLPSPAVYCLSEKQIPPEEIQFAPPCGDTIPHRRISGLLSQYRLALMGEAVGK